MKTLPGAPAPRQPPPARTPHRSPEPRIGTALEALTAEHGYAAYATYKAIIDEFGAVQPYTNILGSAQMHIGLLVDYLEGAGVEIPDNPWLGAVYDDLLERLRGMSEDRHLPAFEAALETGGVGTMGGMGHGGASG